MVTWPLDCLLVQFLVSLVRCLAFLVRCLWLIFRLICRFAGCLLGFQGLVGRLLGGFDRLLDCLVDLLIDLLVGLVGLLVC